MHIPTHSDALLPLEDTILTGRLDNGLTYYIRKNEKPKKRVELRLAVNVGSIVEEDAEQGLAHFVEHMCFKGSQNFPGSRIVESLQEIGVEFGADLNAYTGFDRTIYMLPIPEEHLEKGLEILREWAGYVSFEDRGIDSERKVILEELRIGQGAEQRMREKWLPVVFSGSKYAHRLPIGKKEILENFDHELIRKFYKKWYRPELLAVIAVGDLEVEPTRDMIVRLFSSLPPSQKGVPPRLLFPVPDRKETLVSIQKDKEAPYTVVQLMYKHPRRVVRTYADYRAMF